jgi:hypothetical protein
MLRAAACAKDSAGSTRINRLKLAVGAIFGVLSVTVMIVVSVPWLAMVFWCVAEATRSSGERKTREQAVERRPTT